MSLTVSVYIPCFNAERTIGACIASLISQQRKPDEIILVDDGSTDRSVEIATRYPGVKLVKFPGNKGLATARNAGVRFSKGELIASIDSDCAADPRWLRILVEEMERDPDLCGVAGGVQETELGTIADRWRTYHMAQHYGQNRVDNPRFLYGANTLFRRHVLVRAGSYPAYLRTNAEDFQICKQIYKNVPNAKLRYIPSAYVNHLRRDTLRSLANTYWKYQTYLHWRRAVTYGTPRTFLDVNYQVFVLVSLAWGRQLVWDLKRGRLESVLVAMYLTCKLPWLQIREYFRHLTALKRVDGASSGTVSRDS
ncbi:glycosyltransferase [Nisaea acidiphila]|uniref:Glycosyltransferase n=1 Tax=Nisaea acidiphila TaxID=1862145 RepID=A0A9J7AWY8_9PROT|nr:glycosyltransferase family 2 protein [Nisaea acidiphila]UUX51879.1 glycosyltransferase [Nisaea acidiphila]